MWKKLKDSRTFYIVLSLLLAFIIWGYVVSEVNPTKEQSISNIPVIFQGEDVLEAKNLMVTAGMYQTVTLNFRADWDTISRLSSDNVRLVVQLGGISEAGEYRLQAEITYPSDVSRSNISILNDEARYITFTVSNLVSREIPVQAKFDGSVADGYQAGEFTVTPSTVVIRGQEEVVNQVDHAEVVLGLTDLTETFEGDLPITFMDSQGQEVTSENIQCDVSTVYVVYPIVMVKEIPLTVSFVAGGGATEANIDQDTFSISPSTIWVSGPEEVLSTLTELSIGEIDLSMVDNTPNTTLTFPINLSDSLTNESGISEATVTLTITGLSMQEFEVDNIELINIPEGYSADLVTQSRVVLVRGTQEELDQLFQSQIQIVADLSQLSSTGVGRQTVPATVNVTGGGSAGAVGRYSVVVNLTRE